MYARIPQITRLADDPSEHRPVIQCEYAHAMGNGLGNYREYWEAIYKHPHLQVGFRISGPLIDSAALGTPVICINLP